MARYTQLGFGDSTPPDDYYSMPDEICEVVDDVLPNIKALVLLDIEHGCTALEIIGDLTWLWSHITDSSVDRWCRAINNAVNRQTHKKPR